jgi:hypothetical protein
MNVFFARALVLAFPCAAMAQIAVLQIKVLDGESAVHPAGAHIVHPITVEVTDDSGHPVAGAAVSFQLPPEGPSGLFSNGLRTDLILTDSSGRASIHSVQLNRLDGPLRIRITAVKEQARAGAVCLQYIGPYTAAKAVPVPATSAKAGPPPAAPPARAPEQPSARSPEITPTINSTAKSGEITPTTASMGPGIRKKWLIVAAIVAVGAGVALAGVMRSKSGSGTGSTSTVSSSVVSIGTPTVTIGNP